MNLLVVEGVRSFLRADGAPTSELDPEVVRRLRHVVEIRNPELRRELGLRQDPIELREVGDPSIRVTGVAGSLTLGPLRLEIKPKYSAPDGDEWAWQDNLIALMEFSVQRRVSFASTKTSALGQMSFADRLAYAYAEALRRGRTGPPIREYRSIEQEGRSLRGRLRVTAQVRLSLRRPDLVAFERSELDTDGAHNRLLRWATARLISSARDAGVRRRLQREQEHLPGLGPVTKPSRLPGPVSRQYASWDEALALASAAFTGRGLTRGLSSISGADFVVGTERLFESFLERRLAEIAARRQDWTSVSQHRSRFAVSRSERRDYFSQPDNLLTTSTGLGLVVDAKYKRFSDAVDSSSGRPTNADLYQMVAACVAHHQLRALLLYPAELSFPGGEAEKDPPSTSVVWWETRLAAGKHINVGAASIDVGSIRDTATLHRFDSGLEYLISGAMKSKMKALEE